MIVLVDGEAGLVVMTISVSQFINANNVINENLGVTYPSV